MQDDTTALAIIGREAAIKNRGDLNCEGLRGAIHDDIELARGVAEQQVTRGSADQLDVLPSSGQHEQLRTSGQLMQALEHRSTVDPLIVHLRACHAVSAGPPQPIRTGMPAAARCALASAIVWRP